MQKQAGMLPAGEGSSSVRRVPQTSTFPEDPMGAAMEGPHSMGTCACA